MKREEFVQELTGHIIPFWNKLRDDENGGFTGFMDSALNVDKKGEKGVILHSRILWFYSNAYMELKNPALLDMAKHAYEFLTQIMTQVCAKACGHSGQRLAKSRTFR